MMILALVIVAVVAFAVVLTVGSVVDERAAMRASLRRVEGYDLTGSRDQELLAPLRERAIGPAVQSVVGLGRRLTPVGYLDSIRRKHVKAGMPDAGDVDRFMVQKILGLLLVPLAFVLVYIVADLDGMLGLAAFGLLALGGLVGPDAILNRKVEERTHQVQIALPDILDLLVISVEAGLGFEQALDRVIDSVPGPLTDELMRMLGEVRAGSSRSDAMRALEARLDIAEVRSFIFSMLQADTFGVSIGRVLRTQADEMRIKRRQLAQERAQKAPVKMLIPMVFCIFPALFVVVIGPAVIDISEQF